MTTDEGGQWDEGPSCCVACNSPISPRAARVACENCLQRYPPSLLKAMVDPFDYILCTRRSGTIRFESASAHGDWVHLTLGGWREGMMVLSHPFPRGLDIRLDEIVWCADAPNGS